MLVSTLPSLTKNDRANMFSIVSEKVTLFKTRDSNLTVLFFLKISNMVTMFLSVSDVPCSSLPASYAHKWGQKINQVVIRKELNCENVVLLDCLKLYKDEDPLVIV